MIFCSVQLARPCTRPTCPETRTTHRRNPGIALANAEKTFFVEGDIEAEHHQVSTCGPFTLVPPRYKESFVVSLRTNILFKNISTNCKKSRVRAE